MIKYNEIKCYEPCFLNKCIFATLFSGKKIKINLEVKDQELSWNKFKNIVENFKSKVYKENTKIECSEDVKEEKKEEIRIKKPRKVKTKTKRKRKFRYSFVRKKDNKKMNLQQISELYNISKDSARALLKIYGEINGDHFRVFYNSIEIKPKKTKIEPIKYKINETGEVDTASNFAKKYNWDVAHLRTSISIRKKYKNYHFELQGEC